MRVADTTGKKVLWAVFLLFLIIAGVLYVGAKVLQQLQRHVCRKPKL